MGTDAHEMEHATVLLPQDEPRSEKNPLDVSSRIVRMGSRSIGLRLAAWRGSVVGLRSGSVVDRRAYIEYVYVSSRPV